MRNAPRMRVSHLQSNLAALRHLGPTVERTVLADVAEVADLVNASIRTGWLPLEHDIAVTDAVERAIGRAGMKRWAQDAIVESARGPLLGPVLRGLRAVGLNPQRALRRAEGGWRLIYRGFGELHYADDGATHVLLRQLDVPASCFDSPGYFHGIAGAWEGVLALTGGAEGRSEVELDPARREIRYRCSWS